MNKLLSHHFFWKHAVRNGFFSKPTRVLYRKSMALVRFTYVGMLMLLFVHFYAGNNAGTQLMYHPLWPVQFLKSVPVNQLYLFFHVVLFLVFSFTAMYPRKVGWRLLSFVFYFMYVAFLNSFGKINHSLHLPLILLFCLVFVPDKKTNQYREKTILAVATAQFFVLFAYSLTGFWKVFWGVIEFFTKDVSLFSPLTMRNIIIRDYQLTSPTLVGEFLLEYYIIAWWVYLVAVYVEFFSVLVFFKPQLHRIWGCLLLGLHFGTHLILNVNMHPAPLVLGVLFINSPFYKKTSVLNSIKTLPIIDWFTFFTQKFLQKKPNNF